MSSIPLTSHLGVQWVLENQQHLRKEKQVVSFRKVTVSCRTPII